jgi:hypothetical protein
MSFIDSIVDLGKSAWNFISSDSLGSNVVKTILTGYALNQVTKTVNAGNKASSETAKTSTPTTNPGNKLQIAPAGENRIPVVYGTAIVGGVITDVKMSADNQKMTFAVTACEVTGTKMSDGQPSQFSFEDVYIDNNRVVFDSDGITASYMIDPDGNVNRSIKGLIKVYCYRDGSSLPVVPDNYTNGSLLPAYSRMPGWTSAYTMSKLVFAIVEVTYSQEKNITALPNMSFAVTNTMTMPGDCLFDYMTSTRYGAGINPLEIKSA